MLDRLTGKEITSWMAYERVNGPLDNSWRDEQLAVLLELVQQNTSVTGAVGQAKKNPAPKPKPIVRPWEMYKKAKEQAISARYSETAGGEIVLEDGEVNPFGG
jgi:hypothetical protein